MSELFEPTVAGLPLLRPERERWQPLRLGLVELFHYDSEEFWFRDGHLLLRGNNGTGKSKVLSLTLPFLFDANLRSSRIEPDGDPGKKMGWNLLVNRYARRMGYSWIEFGRLAQDGSEHYLTLGAGLQAVDGRPQVESWFFILEDPGGGARIGQDLWLTSEQRVVLTRERLREAIEGHGQVFESAEKYRRAVDERLFQLGSRRYGALMDTLIQLRHPQLSKKPDEAGLSHALTEALPPLSAELLGDVAEALNQLEEDRRQLEDIRELMKAVHRFDGRYRIYAGMLARRQARELRQAQTEFDHASQERNLAQVRKQEAQIAEDRTKHGYEEAERKLAADRARLETLQSDPTMQDANRLEHAERDAANRRRDAEAAQRASMQAEHRLEREEKASDDRRRAAERAGQSLAAALEECTGQASEAGIADFVGNPLARPAGESLSGLSTREFENAVAALRAGGANRRAHLALLRRRHGEVETRRRALAQREEMRLERRAELDEIVARRAAADFAVEQTGRELVEAWAAFCSSLVQLRFEEGAALAALVEWVVNPQGRNPARQALELARGAAETSLSRRQVELETRSEALELEVEALHEERAELVAGRDTAPPAPYTRAAGSRRDAAGAPLWQLVEFQEAADADQRSGIEAALEASGLLDAWVSPDGSLLAAGEDGSWHDSRWSLRPPVAGLSLGHWLRAAVAPEAAVAESQVSRLLAGIGGAADDEVEAWIAADGRFRLGTLAGAFAKPEARYIGHAARETARLRRLGEIARQLGELVAEKSRLSSLGELLEGARRRLEEEWQSAPSGEALHSAILQIENCSREYEAGRSRLDRAESFLREAEQDLKTALSQLERDATDLRLPFEAESLTRVEEAIQRFVDASFALSQSARDWRQAIPELRRQEERESEAREDAGQQQKTLGDRELEAREALARFSVLRETVGLRVDSLRHQLSEARTGVLAREESSKRAAQSWREAGEALAVARTQADHQEDRLSRLTAVRSAAVNQLQRFAATSLLSSAVPELELPDARSVWTIDPALTLARRIEQALNRLPDDESGWSRVQRQIADDLQELQRTLAALSHQVDMESNDWGMVVHIIFQNRRERPDRLIAILTDDVAERTELLSASERVVLENHLQTEIAAEVQRLLRAADQQVTDVNRELHKRPTSTGVRFRLQWQPLSENDGAPLGLGIARERLLNTSADLWTAEDRRAIGTMLQQRILDERERAQAMTERGGDGGLIDQLARALDYRRWHRFRVERLQDGQWRKLSGPASSGERALGLTVPLFAAIASFYSRSDNPIAPRLMLLDEAFAGIDDDARAHCMALIRDFDLDFVITSEREWACYAELPGVSICQLQRREGIDAVYVSRWTWDGRSKRREEDPNRRFPPA